MSETHYKCTHCSPVSSCKLGRGSDRTPLHCSSTGRGMTMRPSASWGKSLMKLLSLWKQKEERERETWRGMVDSGEWLRCLKHGSKTSGCWEINPWLPVGGSVLEQEMSQPNLLVEDISLKFTVSHFLAQLNAKGRKEVRQSFENDCMKIRGSNHCQKSLPKL